MAADGLAAKTTITRLGAYAADDRYVFIAPVACTVRSMGYVGDTTVASDTGSNWTFTVNNKSTGLGMAATAVNSAGVADTYYSVGTITGATLVANDVLELTLGSNATPTSVGEGSFVVEWE